MQLNASLKKRDWRTFTDGFKIPFMFYRSSQNALLCVFAHPDDEAFGPSGTIAKFASNRDVYLICVTDGDDKTNGYKESLIKIRKRELLASAKILGVKKVFFLGFKDGCLCNDIYHQVADKIQIIVNEIKPDALLTYEPHGVSGHIDHVFCSMVTSYVFRENKTIKNIFYYCIPKIRARLMADYFIYFPDGYSKSQVNKVEDISAYWNQKILAIKAHVSQKKDGDKILKLMKLRRFLRLSKEEYFLVKRR